MFTKDILTKTCQKWIRLVEVLIQDPNHKMEIRRRSLLWIEYRWKVAQALGATNYYSTVAAASDIRSDIISSNPEELMAIQDPQEARMFIATRTVEYLNDRLKEKGLDLITEDEFKTNEFFDIVMLPISAKLQEHYNKLMLFQT